MMKDTKEGQTFACTHTSDGSVCQKCLGRCCEKCEATIEKGLYTCGDSSCLCHQTEQADTSVPLEGDGWIEAFRQNFWQLYNGYPEGDFSKRIEDFITRLLKEKEAEHQQCADEMTKQIEEAYERGKTEVTN